MRHDPTSSVPGRTNVPQRRDRNPGLRRVLRGLYVPATQPTTLDVTVNALLRDLPPGAAISHCTAARLWGGVVPEHPEVHISVPGRSRGRRTTVRYHRRTACFDTVVRRGLVVTTPLQTFIDLALELPLVDLVVLGDTLVARGWFTPEDLAAGCAGHTGRGCAPARRAAAYVRSGVESPMESRLRMLLVLAGYPEPVVNPVVSGRDGRTYRVDLAWPSWRLAVEYDGRQHVDSARQWTRDIMRREDFDHLGWRLVVVTARDMYGGAARLLDRIDAALGDVGAPVPRRHQGWEAHFPPRVP